MRIALSQMKLSGRMKRNCQKALLHISAAAEAGAQLICFPELQLSRFFPQYQGLDASDWAVSPDSPYVLSICEACKKSGIYAIPNFFVRENDKFYDMSLLIDNNGWILGKQKMVHIAQADCFFEQDYYTPSEEGFRVFYTPLGCIGIVVCFDRHYPESVRTCALQGADLIVIPTANTTEEPSELFQWEVKVQAFQNSVNIAMCNRVGTEGKMTFSGESIVADYNGTTLALAGSEEELLIAEVNLPGAARARKLKPYTSLRRPELYL